MLTLAKNTILLKLLFTEKDTTKKVTSIGQAIVPAICPRVVIMALQLRLAVEIHHHFASRYLIDTLNDRGRARGPAGFDAPFNMGSTKCEIEWNSNFEVRYLTD